MVPFFLLFSSFWNGNVYNWYSIPVPSLYFGVGNLFSSFKDKHRGRGILPHKFYFISKVSTMSDLSNLDEIWVF